jgi:CBS domain-containing protein
MRAGDVMMQKVISVGLDATAAQAVDLMLKHRISGLPVVDSGARVVGIITEGDFLRRAELGTQRRRSRWLEFLIGPGRLASEYVHTHGRKVSELMTPDPYMVTEETPLEEVVQTMERRRIKRLPVVREGQLVGIVSRANLLQALATLSRHAKKGAIRDATIRKRVLAELSKQSWAQAGLTNVIVQGGVVDLWGSIMDERERQAMIVAAENVPGVKQVRDHLVWIEPVSGMTVYSEEPAAAPASVA